MKVASSLLLTCFLLPSLAHSPPILILSLFSSLLRKGSLWLTGVGYPGALFSLCCYSAGPHWLKTEAALLFLAPQGHLRLAVLHLYLTPFPLQTKRTVSTHLLPCPLFSAFLYINILERDRHVRYSAHHLFLLLNPCQPGFTLPLFPNSLS